MDIVCAAFPLVPHELPVLARLLDAVCTSSSALESRKPDLTVNHSGKSRPARAEDLAQGETAQPLLP